jgi:type IV fimbrial biogenesis protein FimT
MTTQGGLASRRRSAGGFTLVEVMITVAIMAILAAAAAPSIRDLVQRNRISAYSNELISVLALTRSEAIRRGTTAELKSVTGGSPLTAGWQVEAATFGDSTPQVVQKRETPLKSAEFSDGPNPKSISFNSRGGLDEVDGTSVTSITFNLIPSDCASGREVGRTIKINAVGRITSEAYTCL